MKVFILTILVLAKMGTFAQTSYHPFMEKGKWGFVGSNNVVSIQPTLTYASDFSDGLALAAKEGDYMSSQKGFINEKGEWIIPPKYLIAGDFSEGLARVQINYKWAYINKKDEVVIPPQFQLSYEFKNGYAQAQKSTKWGLIDKTGNFVVENKYYNITDYSGKVYGCQETMYKKWVLKDLSGKTISTDSLKKIGNFNEGLAPARNLDGLWGFIDETGKWVIAPVYTNAHIFSGGLAAVETGYSKWGFVDKTGKVVVTPEYDRHAIFRGNWARVEKGSEAFYIDKTGKRVYTIVK